MDFSGNLNGYFSEYTNQDDEYKVLKVLLEKGASYATEIGRETDLNIEVVNRALFNLKRDGYADKTHADEDPNALMRGRIKDMNASGVIGLGMFRQFSWWCPTLKGLALAQDLFKGKGVQVRASVLIHYNLLQGEEFG